MTSLAAVAARGMGKPCVSGAGSIRVDYNAQTMTVSGQALKIGDIITIDGANGQVLLGQVKMLEPELSGEFATLMGWADKVRRMKVRANAETPLDARTARNFGPEGVGLCRTEHMFFEGDRTIVAVREMILSDDEAGRRAALAKLQPMQRADFVDLFTIMSGLPVTIRLLDPPLHEFLPHTEAEMQEVATAMNASVDKLKRRAAELHEFNPMLGFRGCRLAVAYPGIAEVQTRAILEPAVEAGRATGKPIVPEIMVPLVMTKAELSRKGADRRHGERREDGDRRHGRISDRHDDRVASCGAARRRHRREGGVLLLRNQRPDEDGARHLPRRRS
ncbi:pyruvate,phosphate dikinase [Bradyrhizobium sp. GM22.5]